jgi:hypothetical protein
MAVHCHHDQTITERGLRASRSITTTDRLYPPSTSKADTTSGELRSRLLQLIVANEQSRKVNTGS